MRREQGNRAAKQRKAGNEEGEAEQKSGEGLDRSQPAIRVAERNLDIQDVQERQPPLAILFSCSLDHELACGRRVALHQAAFQQLGDEILQFVRRQAIGPKSFFVFALDFAERVGAIHEAQEEVLFFIETEVAHRDRILDHVNRLNSAVLGGNAQILPGAYTNALSAFQSAGSFEREHDP